MRLVRLERRDGARGVGVLGEGGLTDLFEAGYASTLEPVRAVTDEGGLVALVGAALARLGGSSWLPGPRPRPPAGSGCRSTRPRSGRRSTGPRSGLRPGR